jgi:uncharacterized protein
MAKIPEALQQSIATAFPGNVCLIGTVSKDGFPNISPKGSVVVLDGDTLAYWERSKRKAWENVKDGSKVVVWYRNPELRQTLLPAGGAARFYGTATVHESGALRDQVWDKVVEPEKKADPEKKGAAIVIKLDRAEHLNGKPLE